MKKNIFLAAALIFLSGIGVVGCKSSKHTTTTSERNSAECVEVVTAVDSMKRQEASVSIAVDSSAMASEDRGTILIVRDSLGRPTSVSWTRNLRAASTSRASESKVAICEAMNKADSLRNNLMRTESTKEKKVAEHTAGNPVNAVGWFMITLLICFLAYVVAVEFVIPFIKKQGWLK